MALFVELVKADALAAGSRKQIDRYGNQPEREMSLPDSRSQDDSPTDKVGRRTRRSRYRATWECVFARARRFRWPATSGDAVWRDSRWRGNRIRPARAYSRT